MPRTTFNVEYPQSLKRAVITSAIFLALAISTPLSAAEESCTPRLSMTLTGVDGPIFEGDRVRVSADMGAGDIDGGSYIDIAAFGYALSCHQGQGFSSCVPVDGTAVGFENNISTNCKDTLGNPSVLNVPEGNIVPITPTAGTSAIRVPANSTCNVQWDAEVVAMADGASKVSQALGWPVDGYPTATCSNGLTTSGSATMSFRVASCDIEVKKQVSLTGADGSWLDADTEQTALNLGQEDGAYYRLLVTNTSTVDHVDEMHVVDVSLGIDTTVPGLDAGQSVTLGGGEISKFNIADRCEATGYFFNEASVEGFCRSGDSPISAIASDKAYVQCLPFDPRSRPGIGVRKTTNGDDANSPTGPYIAKDQPVEWGFTVGNVGGQPITGISVSDNKEGVVTCPKTELAVSEEMTCTSLFGTAVEGQYSNLATVSGTAWDGSPVSNSDPSHYFGLVAAVDIEKTTNGHDADTAPGPNLAVGTTVTWEYTVTNNSNVDLAGVAVSDNKEGNITCPKNTLTPGESMKCSATGTVVAGQYANLGTVNASAAGTPVSDSDPSHYTGQESAIDIEKFTNGDNADQATGPKIDVGDPVNWTYVVKNTGDTTLTAVTVTDNQGEVVSCPKNTLASEEEMTCTASGTATPGQYRNVGTATGTPPVGSDVSDTDPSHYFGVSPASIKVTKEIKDGNTWLDANDANSAPIKHWPAGAEYRITVENDGDVDLENVVINDTELGIVNYAPIGNGGAGELAVDEIVVIDSGDLLALNASSRCDETETVENVANAAGDSVEFGETTTDQDSAFLKCVGTPSLLVEKKISVDNGVTWVDSAGPVDTPSGALYKITVTNNGPVKLVGVEVTDSLLPGDKYTIGVMNPTDVVVVDSGKWPALNMAEVCEDPGPVPNLATVTGTSDENVNDTVQKTDGANLLCIGDPMIEIVKKLSLDGVNYVDANGPNNLPSAVYDPNTPVEVWYQLTVTNTGDVDLTNILVNDVALGIVDYPVADLPAEGLPVVIESGTLGALYTSDACTTIGEIPNTADVVGESATGTTDTDQDHAILECIGRPAIRVVKKVSINGIDFFDDVVNAEPPADAYYRIEVTNTGTTDLVNVEVNDDDLMLYGLVPTGTDGSGKLAVGETVVLVHADLANGTNPNIVPGLFEAELCTEGEGFTFVNTAVAEGTASDSEQTVDDDDNANFNCDARFDICDTKNGGGGRPDRLKMRYDADDDTNNGQGDAAIITPEVVDFPETPVTIKTYSKSNGLLDTYNDVPVNGIFYVYDPNKSGKIPPNIVIEIWDGSTLLQTIEFHGSCSAPLSVGDEYGGVGIIGVDYFQGNARKK